MKREEINPYHPVITEGGKYRMLEDNEILQSTDETACISMLLSMRGCKWVSVHPEWTDDFGRVIGAILGEDSKDADAHDRIFRRKKV